MSLTSLEFSGDIEYEVEGFAFNNCAELTTISLP
jgi:hypothetical protein